MRLPLLQDEATEQDRPIRQRNVLSTHLTSPHRHSECHKQISRDHSPLAKMIALLRRSVASSPSETDSGASALPLYSPLTMTSSPTFGVSDNLLKPAQRHATKPPPTLSRFLADFTLGFADGLTVPFALTAGLSSLGQTETVIYAGMAEICAGSISMGIGGYLSAKGDGRGGHTAAVGCVGDKEEEEEEGGELNEKAGEVVDRYLAPLDLPSELLELVHKHIVDREDIAAAVERKMARVEDNDDEEDGPPPAWISGLSVAIGYLIGGSLPLFPYFIVKEVADGLLWSFVVCVMALFTFGFIKSHVLLVQSAKSGGWMKGKGLQRAGWTWRNVRQSSWEGAQMVILGSLAALAAVLCVRLFEGIGSARSEP